MRASIARIVFAIALFVPATSAVGEEVFFSMANLQSGSRLFGEVAAASQKNNERVQREVVTTGSALDELGDGLESARQRFGAAPADLEARHAELAARFDADWQALNEFVDRLVTDTDRAFMDTLARHVTAIEEREGVTLATCEPPQGMLGMAMGQSSCEGRDVSAELVAAFDADVALAEAVQEITSRTWPSVRAARQAVPSVGLADGGAVDESTVGFSPAVLYADQEFFTPVSQAIEEAYAMASHELQAAQDALEADRYMFAEESGLLIESDRKLRLADMQADLERLQAASEVLTRWRTVAVAGAMALAWELAAAKGDKVAGAAGADAVSVCLQPGDLGGCTGPDVTAAVGEYLAGQKKVVKAVEKYAEGIAGPELGL